MRGLFVVASLTGCFSPSPPVGLPCANNGECPSGLTCQNNVCGGAAPGDGSPGSEPATDDAQPDMFVGCVPWPAPNLGDPCMLGTPMPIDLSGENSWTADTSNGVIKKGNNELVSASVLVDQPGAQQIRVWLFSSLTIPANTSIQIEGGLPGAFVVFGNAVIEGGISASAVGTTNGAGGSAAACTGTGGGAPVGAGAGGGGGAGGTYADVGGGGGSGNTDGISGGTAGSGGAAGAVHGETNLEPLVSGCRGELGRGPGASGLGGGAGGAFEITASGSITIDAVVQANGGGGVGGSLQRGGSGGGSGGALLINGDTVTIGPNGRIVANGGGGGGGGNSVSNGIGGTAGRTDSARSNGGGGAGGAGNGGLGGAGTTLTGNAGGTSTAAAGGGGGGGGGSVGRIVIKGRSATPTIDPVAIVSPAAN